MHCWYEILNGWLVRINCTNNMDEVNPILKVENHPVKKGFLNEYYRVEVTRMKLDWRMGLPFVGSILLGAYGLSFILQTNYDALDQKKQAVIPN